MILGFSIIAFFAAISVYYYFRAENLSRQLQIAKKEVSSAKRDQKQMADAMAIIAKKNGELAQSKFKKLQEINAGSEQLELLRPLINNYTTIFIESVKAKGQMAKVAKKCCESHNKGSFKQLTTFIGQQEAQVRQYWSSNNVAGFIAFIDTILVVLEKHNTASTAT